MPAGLTPAPDRETVLQLQSELAREGDFAALLSRDGLQLDLAALTPFARWVPKFHAVRRFDTMFFVAPCPPGDWPPNVVAARMRRRPLAIGQRRARSRGAR